jgi:hypothetical protein
MQDREGRRKITLKTRFNNKVYEDGRWMELAHIHV